MVRRSSLGASEILQNNKQEEERNNQNSEELTKRGTAQDVSESTFRTPPFVFFFFLFHIFRSIVASDSLNCLSIELICCALLEMMNLEMRFHLLLICSM